MRRFSPLAPRRTVLVRLVSGIVLACGLAASTIQAQIPGRNVNMVSGNSWPNGDPFLQRQNEPSIAASTRNPLHLLAGANDYRTVDLPGLPGDETGDAWLGLFKSFDGGQRWTSTLLPGYPQDQTAIGLASPIKGYAAGADPVVRAGTNGLMYYAGLAFDRSAPGSTVPGKSAIFVARYIDNNNNEAADTFRYLGTRALATDPGGATGNFLDKPWMAVDIPRDANRCTITTSGTETQSIPAGPVYVAYTLKSKDSIGDRYDIMFVRSADCGNTWTNPIRVNDAADRASQGATIAIDPRNGDVHVAWRRFDLTGDNDALMAAKFSATGKKFDKAKEGHKPKKAKKDKKKQIDPAVFYTKGGVSKAIEAAELSPLDQGTSDIAGLLAFRTNAYPSLTVDGTGRVYMVWAERGYDTTTGPADPIAGDARILISSSLDGKTWTAAKTVAAEGQRGHQLMPTITFAGGKLMLVYYDLRETRSEVFSKWIDDATALAGAKQLRHTIDLRASLGTPGASPVFAPSVQVSDYLMGSGKTGVTRQLQVNPPNLPMFKLGTAPFMGDYVDITAAPNFVVDATGKWTYNSTASTTLPVFHATWTDNRDVRPPLEDPNNDGNPWNDFTPPGALGGGVSILDNTTPIAQCIPGNAGSRNQNIYTARITGGILAGSPGNTKPLSTDLQRSFVVFVQNTTDVTRTFRLSIANQPVGGRASFNQFLLPPFTNTEAPLTTIDAQITPRSTASRTVYATSSDPNARITITVTEVNGIGGAVVAVNPLGATIVLNPDIDNPDIDNPDIDNPDIDNPDIDNPDIDNTEIANAEVFNPDIDNPDIDNPDIDNPDIDNPDIDNPDIDNVRVANPDIDNPVYENPDIDNPDIDNPDIDNNNILNPDIDNPDIDNPDIDNPDIDNSSPTDISWTITNTGNTTAAYNVNLFFAQTTIKPQLSTQLILYRTYRTPVVVNCVLKYETRNVLVANVPSPELVASSGGAVSDPNDPEATNATIWLAPGESAKITLRVADSDKSDDVLVTNADGSTALVDPSLIPNEDVTPVVQQQSANTEEVEAGNTEPPIVVQFPAPETVPDFASTAPLTPVTINVLANDSTAFGSTKVFSLHPPNMASHSGGGPGDIAYQSSTGFLYTQRGIVDPVTDALVGRLPLPPTGGLTFQVANQRTGINYGRTGGATSAISALDARPGSATFHSYLAMPPLPPAFATDTILGIALDATNGRLYALHGPASPTVSSSTTVTAIDVDPASATFHQVLGSVTLPTAGLRGQGIAVNTRTERIYVTTTNATSTNVSPGVFMIDPNMAVPAAIKITGGSLSAWSLAVNESANLIYAATNANNGSNYALVVIDGNTNAATQVNSSMPMRFGPVDERMVVHQATGRVFMRLESSVVVIDTLRGSPARNTVIATIPGLGRDGGGQADIAIDQQLGLVVTVGGLDYRAEVINGVSNPPVLAGTIPLLAGPTDVDIDPVNHRAFVAVPLTHVQEFSLTPIGGSPARVAVFVESGGLVINPTKEEPPSPLQYNRAYAGILAVGGSVGVVSGTGFGGTINGLNPASRFLFSARHNASNRFWIVSSGNPAGDSNSPGKVIVIDGATDTLEETVAVEAAGIGHTNPFGIAIDQVANKVYVGTTPGNGVPGAITVFNALDPQSPRVDVPVAPGFPVNLNTTTLVPTGQLGFGRHLVINPNTQKLYALQIAGSPTSLAVYNPLTNLLSPLDGLTTAPVNGLPAAPSSPVNAPGAWGRVDVIRVDATANRIYLGMFDSTTGTNRIVALNGVNDEVVGSWIGGKHSNRHTASYLIVNEGANRLYVANYDNDTVTMLDATTMTPIGAPLTLPDGPSAMAFSEGANRLYVSSINAKTLTAIDGDTFTIQSSIRMPLVAQFIFADEIESRIYTSGGDSADESGIMVINDVLGQLGTEVSVAPGLDITTYNTQGSVVRNDDYSVTYTPPTNTFSGIDRFGYTVVAPTGTATGVVSINVVPANPVSVAFGDSYATGLNQNLVVAAPGPLANDATGAPGATMVVTNSTDNGVITPQADGSFVYDPNDTFNGLDSFEYHVQSALGLSNTVTVTISVASGVQFTVTNTNDSGVGSLRQAMTTANLEPGAAIAFAIPGAGPHVIAPLSPLPTMNVPVTIDGYTQVDPLVANSAAVPNSAAVGTNAVLKIVLQGPASGSNPTGLNLRGGDSIVRGLVMSGWNQTTVTQTGTSYSGQAILLDNLGNNLVEGNFIGTNAAGTAAAPNAIGVSSQSPNNTIGGSTPESRNLISGNNAQGARALATSSGGVASSVGSGTRFKNNLIGTTATGMAALPNGGGGLTMSAPGVIIGGPSAAERNVIAGNVGLGINAFANTFDPDLNQNGNGPLPAFPISVPSGLTIQGNFIGTNALGTAALANTGGGISSSGAGTIIGGSNPTPLTLCSGACNLISGNTGTGVNLNNSYDSNIASPTAGLLYSSAANSFVEGNFIGVNVTGTAALGNTSTGLNLAAPTIRVGGGTPETRNVIAGNGVTTNNSGIQVSASTSSSPSANNGAGAFVVAAAATDAWIRGNYIGVNAAGTGAIANYNGITVNVPSVRVGGTTPGDRNIISGNLNTGVNTFANSFNPNAGGTIATTKPDLLVVEGNYIGVSFDASTAIANIGSGIRVSGADTRIGGTTGTSLLSCTGACNLISGNTNPGPGPFSSAINVQSDYNNTTGAVYSQAINSQILGNFIGVNLTGDAAMPNNYGLNVNAPNVTVGGAAAGARNVVSGNTQSGISIGTTVTGANIFVNDGSGAKIWGNYVGVNANGSAPLTNGQCGICAYAPGVAIGGPNANEGNLVASTASQSGISLDRSFGSGNVVLNPAGTATVQRNIIGLDKDGEVRLNTTGSGIRVASAGNTIVDNVVAGHTGFGSGISLSGSAATGNSVRGNMVGTNRDGDPGLGNGGSGITLRGSSNNTIGGLAPGDGNVIVGNGGNGGVEFYAFTSDTMTGNQVVGNYIGVVPGNTAVPNSRGIWIYANPAGGPGNPAGIVTGNTIGGSTAAARNVISGNNGDGIQLGGIGTTGNSIIGNYIGTTIDGSAARPNTGSGVSLSEGQANTVGGNGAGDGNLIAFNNGRGVVVFNNSLGNRILGNAIRENGNLAIDLGSDGATANDDTDTDTGANNRQNYPVLVSASTVASTTSVDADFSSFAAGQYTVQFFASATCDVNGNSRGERLAGSFDNVSAGGTQTFQLTPALAAGEYVTATATDAAGNTSELSPCYLQADVAPAAVTNTDNSGSGSLRNAITYANTVPGSQTITFNIAGAGPHTIQPTSMLPILQGPVVIDGYSQPGATRNTLSTGGTDAVLKIVLNGANATGAWAGLAVGSGGATIRGLVINGYTTNNAQAILLDNPTGNSVVAGNFLGTDATGTIAVANGWGVVTHSPNSVIGGSLPADRNLISGNGQSGVQVSAAMAGQAVSYQAIGTSVRNNLIGTNAGGTAALGNSKSGIEVSIPGVTIGGTNAADRNIVAGNGQSGISAYSWTSGNTTLTSPSGLRIEGNYIGTNASGMAALPNGGGIAVNGASPIIGGTVGTTPGGACTGACNLISGNNFTGVQIQNQFDYNSGTFYSSATNATVQGNYIGVNVLGTSNLPNTGSGIDVSAGSATIGGNTAAARNVVSGNNGPGINLFANYTATNTVVGSATGAVLRGNYIGLDATGTVLTSNGSCGICASVTGITIGGAGVGDGNLAAGNSTAINLGRQMNGPATIDAGGNSTVQGNTIGLSSAGARLSAGGTGLYVSSGNNQIRQNTVAGNGAVASGVPGISLNGPFAIGNFVRGNFVGTTSGGAALVGNTGMGIQVNDAPSNTIGGTIAADRNVIAGNGGGGITINTSPTGSANNNLVLGNHIGVLSDGVTPRPNLNHGITVSPAIGGTIAGTIIGGSAAGSGNVVASNTGNGIAVYGAVSTTTITGNFVGIDSAQTVDLGNTAAGIWISDSGNNTIGGANPGEANVIAFNDQTGVGVQGTSAVGNRILGNRVFSNGGAGIDLSFGGNNNQAAPVLSNATNGAQFSTVDADLSALAPGTYTLEFFQGSACGQGDTFVSRFTNVNQGPAANFMLTELVPAGRYLTATATDAAGNTSSFSSCTQVSGDPLTVSNANDSGSGSLRAAITYANATPGLDIIRFSIGTPGTPAVITLASALPPITEQVVIDATISPSTYDGMPVVELSGGGSVATGLETAPDVVPVTLRGLAITRFNGAGINLLQADSASTGHLIDKNYIGTDRNGSLGKGNVTGILIRTDLSGITDNVIAGNTGSGIVIEGDADNVVVQGNKIGLAPNGLSALPNGASGIVMYGSLDDVWIQNNTITGNTGWGIDMQASGADPQDTIIRGNTIGLLVNGNLVGSGPDIVGETSFGPIVNFGPSQRGNRLGGIHVAKAAGTIIGEAGNGNTISGNTGNGILLEITAVGNAPRILGNIIGLDPTGTKSRGNTVNGIESGVNGTQIGGYGANEGNVISGNVMNGVVAASTGTGQFIRKNLVGLNAAGAGTSDTDGIPFGNGKLTNPDPGCCHAGIMLFSSNNTVHQNVVANMPVGIRSTASGAPNTIDENFIGTGIGGGGAFGNAIGVFLAGDTTGARVIRNYIYYNLQDGIQIAEGTSNAVIGGSLVNANNIGVNQRGIMVGYDLNATDANNTISYNTIANNTGMGIDLGNDGVTANDPGDGDGGPNGRKNYPIVTSAKLFNGTDVTLDTTSFANTAHDVQLYSVPSCDANNYGEGATYLETFNLTAPGIHNLNVPQTVAAGWYITAITIGPNGTSEFSNCQQVVVEVGSISTAQPSPVGIGAGQMLTIDGSNMQGTQASHVLFTQGGNTYPASYTWQAGPNRVVARTPIQLVGGQATTVRVTNGAVYTTPPFSINVSTVPGAPILVDAYSGSCGGGYTGPVTTVAAGGGVVVTAMGVDSNGAATTFVWTPVSTGISTTNTGGATCGGSFGGVYTSGTVPTGAAYTSGASVKLEIRTTTAGGTSSVSNPIFLTIQ